METSSDLISVDLFLQQTWVQSCGMILRQLPSHNIFLCFWSRKNWNSNVNLLQMGSSGGQVVLRPLRNWVGEGRSSQAALRRAGRWTGWLCLPGLCYGVFWGVGGITELLFPKGRPCWCHAVHPALGPGCHQKPGYGTRWHKRCPPVVVAGVGCGECKLLTWVCVGLWLWGGLVPQSQVAESEWVSLQSVVWEGPEWLFSKQLEEFKVPSGYGNAFLYIF